MPVDNIPYNFEQKDMRKIKIETLPDGNLISKIGMFQVQFPIENESKFSSYSRARDKAANELAYTIIDNMKHTTSEPFGQGYETLTYHTFTFMLLLEDERKKLKTDIRELYHEQNRLISRINFLQKQPWYEQLFMQLKTYFN